MPTDPALVLFDLDGTLVDTAPDMAGALNRLLAEQGRAALPLAQVRPQVSNGALALVELGFGRDLEAARHEHLRQRFLRIYREDLALGSRLFDGMDELLLALERAGTLWGVVTNKPGWLTEPLLQRLGLLHRCACVVSGDTLSERKPHPAPLLHACASVGIDPARSLYVGDAERDIAAARAAGMPSLVAVYGYIGADVAWPEWRADGWIDKPEDLIGWCFPSSSAVSA